MIIKDRGKIIPGAVYMMSIVHNHAKRITDHYVRAREKHPYFCDRMNNHTLLLKEHALRFITNSLELKRRRIRYGSEDGNLCWSELLECKTLEAMEAVVRDDKAHAVEELYDCIAVLLRTIDVLEGRQKLGKPETKGEAK